MIFDASTGWAVLPIWLSFVLIASKIHIHFSSWVVSSFLGGGSSISLHRYDLQKNTPSIELSDFGLAEDHNYPSHSCAGYYGGRVDLDARAIRAKRSSEFSVPSVSSVLRSQDHTIVAACALWRETFVQDVTFDQFNTPLVGVAVTAAAPELLDLSAHVCTGYPEFQSNLHFSLIQEKRP